MDGDAKFPIIRIELEGVKHQIMKAFAGYNDEFEKIVNAQLEKMCTEEYMTHLIHKEIRILVPTLIHDVINDQEIREKLRKSIVMDILDKPKTKKTSKKKVK